VLPFLIAAYLGRSELLVCAVVREAERQGLDPVVVCALVEVESGWRIYARSNTGDSGLFQINKRWHGEYRLLLQHIRKGCAILRDCILASGGSVREGLGRYNAGANRAVGRRYASKVLSLAARIKEAVTEQKYHTSYLSIVIGKKDRLYGFAFEWAPRRRVDKGKG
jgi:soluble lytic murein transglycosylase-like protein